MSISIPLHILSALIWVGGMFFAYMILRPIAAKQFEAEQRLTLWVNIFNCFFKWVWISLITLFVTGFGMIHLLGGMGGMSGVGIHVHIMLLLGIFMALIFLHLYFNSYKKLKRAVLEHDWLSGAEYLNQIRKLVASNLLIGLVVTVIGASGRYW